MRIKADVSIVIATYNGELYLKEQLKSILDQTVLPEEIIVIDDNSSDSTINIAANILSTCSIYYKIIKHDKNQGVNSSFEEGIQLATKSYIMICDQDDIWEKNKIERTISVLESNQSIVLAVCNATIVDSQMIPNGKTMFQYIGLPINFKKQTVYTLMSMKAIKLFLKRNYVTGMCMGIRKEVVEKVLPFSKNMTYDAWIAWNAAKCGNISFLNECLVRYRQHQNNVIGTQKEHEKIKEYYFHRKEDKKKICRKYIDFNSVIADEHIMKNNVNEACQFQQWRCTFREKNTFILFFQMFRNILSGKYKLYTGNSKTEIIKDVVEVLFYKQY